MADRRSSARAVHPLADHARAAGADRGGHIDDLRQLLNLAADGDFILAVAWVLAALRDKGPYPVLVLTGEQGSAKCTCARMLRAFVDPCKPPLRSVPRNEQDLFIAARNGHVLAFDNLSGAVSVWFSDALCQISTGGSYAARKLYTDGEEAVIDAKRPVILNGIDEVVARGDLDSRTINPDPERDSRGGPQAGRPSCGSGSTRLARASSAPSSMRSPKG